MIKIRALTRDSRLEISDAEFRSMSSDELLSRFNSDPEFYKAMQKHWSAGVYRDSKGHYRVFVNKDKANDETYRLHLPAFRLHAARLNAQCSACDPPRLAELFLLLVPIRQREHLLGDLEEEFRTVTVPRHGARIAAFLYAWQVMVELVRAIITGLSGVALGWIFSKFTK